MIRTMRSALEERITVEMTDSIWPWLVEYASYLLNRLEVGKDGKTAYERVKGKKPTILGIEFGEKLLYMVKAKTKMEKLNSRWEHGVFVGVKRKSGEVRIATEKGEETARSVRRIPEQLRWTLDSLRWVKYVPWHRFKDDEEADGAVPEDNLVEPRRVEDPVEKTIIVT